jgi:hypothetical protein
MELYLGVDEGVKISYVVPEKYSETQKGFISTSEKLYSTAYLSVKNNKQEEVKIVFSIEALLL